MNEKGIELFCEILVEVIFFGGVIFMHLMEVMVWGCCQIGNLVFNVVLEGRNIIVKFDHCMYIGNFVKQFLGCYIILTFFTFFS
jgi:hypothetical protein